MDRITLTIRNELGITETIHFDVRMKFMVGRSAECTWRIASPEVSRRHCLFEIDPPHVNVRDLNSLNGTYVNGKRIRGSRELRDTDMVQIGDVMWTVQIRDGSEWNADVPGELEPAGA